MGKKTPRINSKIKMPIPAPGRTAPATLGGVGVEVGVTVGVFIAVIVMVGVGENVCVNVGEDVRVKVAVAGILVGLGVLPWGISVGQGMTPPAASTQVACACALEYGIKRKNRIPSPNKTRIICGFLIPFPRYSGYTCQPNLGRSVLSNCSSGTLICMAVPSASNSFVSAS